jgi:hypothetical protein
MRLPAMPSHVANQSRRDADDDMLLLLKHITPNVSQHFTGRFGRRDHSAPIPHLPAAFVSDPRRRSAHS